MQKQECKTPSESSNRTSNGNNNGGVNCTKSKRKRSYLGKSSQNLKKMSTKYSLSNNQQLSSSNVYADAKLSLSTRPSLEYGADFNNVILREFYKRVVQGKKPLNKLETTFRTIEDAEASFRSLIVEESLEIMLGYIEELGSKSAKADKRLLVHFDYSETSSNSFKFKIEKNSDSNLRLVSREYQSSTFYVLRHVSDENWVMIGFVSPRTNNVVAKKEFFLDMKLSESQSAGLQGKKNQRFWIHVGPGLTTLERMYSTRIKPGSLGFESALLKGNLSTSIEIGCSNIPANTSSSMNTELNDVQNFVVNKVLNTKENSIHLWQGPPGSGKTRCCIQLLKMLVKRGKRILVTGPSNQSVQVLLSRYLADFGGCIASIALVAVEDATSTEFDMYNSSKVLSFSRNLLQCSLVGEDVEIALKTISIIRSRMPVLWGSFDMEVDFVRLKSLATYGRAADAQKQQEEGFDCEEYDESDSAASSTSSSLSSYDHDDSNAVTKSFATSILRRFISKLLSIERDLAKLYDAELEFIQSASLIICTCSVAGRNFLRRALSPHGVDYLIVDEACQSVEAETWIALACSPKHLVLVGDHKQLCATIKSQRAAKAGFQRPLMERLILLKLPMTMLDVQYRMHPEISSFPNKMYYEKRLRDAPCVLTRIPISSCFSACEFFNVNDGFETESNSSYYNKIEAAQIAKIITALSQENIDLEKDVFVITFYSRQVDEIVTALSKLTLLKQPRVSTVDRFQGSEATIVILSFVRANFSGNVGFIADSRRLNVSVTRAKQILIMAGNVSTLERSNSSDLRCMIRDLRTRNLIREPFGSKQ